MRSLITENDVYEVQCQQVPLPPPDRQERNEWLVKFFDSSDRVVESGIVCYSTEVLQITPHLQQEADQAFYAARSVRFKTPHQRGKKKYLWESGNHEDLFAGQKLTDEQLDMIILQHVYTYFSRHPRISLPQIAIEVSIDTDREAIAARLENLRRQGLLSRKRRATDEFQIKPAVIASIRQRLQRSTLQP